MFETDIIRKHTEADILPLNSAYNVLSTFNAE